MLGGASLPHSPAMEGTEPLRARSPVWHSAYLQVFADRLQELVRGLPPAQRHKKELPGRGKVVCTRAAPLVMAQGPGPPK